MNSRREKIRLLLVDDDAAVLKIASEFLSTEFEIAGFASDGAEALDAIERLAPDVIVLDIAVPVLDGIHTARRLRSSENEVGIIFLSIVQGPLYVKAAMNLGAGGYVFKSSLGVDLVPAARDVICGGTRFRSAAEPYSRSPSTPEIRLLKSAIPLTMGHLDSYRAGTKVLFSGVYRVFHGHGQCTAALRHIDRQPLFSALFAM